MRSRKTKQRKDPDLVKERRFELENLFKIANSDPDRMDTEELLGLIYTWAHLMFEGVIGPQLLDFSEMYLKYADGLQPGAPSDLVNARKAFFTNLRDHTRSKFNSIINAVESE